MRRLSLPVFLSGVICALLPAMAFALDLDRTLGELHHTAWTGRNGAPSQINALVQTTDGYLWIGSTRGLFRFDGVQFEPYRPQAGVRLPSHNIQDLAATADGGLWITFRPTGLGFLKDGRMTVFTSPEDLPPSTDAFSIACDPDGRVWAGALNGLSLRVGSRWTSIGSERAFTPDRIRCLLVDREGSLWVGSDTRVSYLRRGSTIFQTTGPGYGLATGFAQAPDGRVWMSGPDGVQVIPLGGASAGDGVPRAGDQTPLQPLFDRDGALWFAVSGGGIRRTRFPQSLAGASRTGAAEPESFHERDGLSSDSAGCLLEDREGNIWIGTTVGLDRFRRSRIVAVGVPAGVTGLTLLAGDDGEVRAGSAAEPLMLRIRGETVRVEKVPMQVSSVYREPSGTIWWGGTDGIWRQRGSGFEHFRQPGTVWEIFRCDSGGLWVAIGEDEIVHFQDGIWTRRELPKALPHRRVASASYEDLSGRIWLGYRGDRVALLDRGTSRLFTKTDGLEIGRIRAIRGRGPHIWFGGELGLSLFLGGRFHTVKTAGTELGTISGIVETRDGDLWLNEMRGIVHITSSEIRRLLADPRRTAVIELLDHRDGLPGAGQMTWTCSTAVEASDGRIWFATDNGLARIDPLSVRRKTVAPLLSIRSLVAEGKAYDTRTPIRLPPRTANLQIGYTALSLSIPERVLYRYRLEGLDRGWQEAGARRTAIYTNPPPGRYRFRVVACNDDGVWNEKGASLDFTIVPTLTQTPAFLVLSVAVFLALAFGAYRWRVAEMRSRLDLRFRERLAERTRIAQDLHDTLLQGVLSASMQLRVAADQLPAESAARPRLDRVLELMDIVGAEGRNALQGLRARLTDLDDLENVFSRIPHELNASEDIVYRVFGEGPPRSLLPVARDGIHRIGREAVVNAFRHSRAKHIDVELRFHEDAVTLLVRDDGCGIAPDVLRSGRRDHWGLSGMRERADELGALLHVRTREGAGTEVELRIPAQIAFRHGTEAGARGWRSWLAARR